LEEETGLRENVDVLIRHWQWVAAAAILAAVAAFVVSLLIPPTYEAEVAVAIVRMRTDVTFTSQMVTLTEDELGNRALDVNARRAALVALATSSNVAVQVLDEVGDRLGPNERNVHVLLDRVEASNEGDLISIRVHHRDPDVTATIANAWARNYQRHVNTLYGTIGELDTTVLTQVKAAEETYNAAQAALEEFLGDNRVAALEREIATRQELLQTYQTARSAVQKEPVDLQLSNRHQVLADYYGDLQEIERWLADLRALRFQVEKGSTSPAARTGNALALIFLRSRALGGSGNLPVQLQVDINAGQSEGVVLDDVDSLAEVLEARLVETQEQIDALTATLATQEPNEVAVESDNPLNLRIAALDVEILALQEELEGEYAQKRELEQVRDLAWDTYRTLTRKQAEVGIASQVTGTEVRVATSAVPPQNPVSPRKVLNTAVAGVLGTMLGIFGAFAIEWWRGREGAGRGSGGLRRHE
jgi:uncharacterized protein involved in exopolysaccharide biosynthesis